MNRVWRPASSPRAAAPLFGRRPVLQPDCLHKPRRSTDDDRKATLVGSPFGVLPPGGLVISLKTPDKTGALDGQRYSLAFNHGENALLGVVK